MLEVWRQSKASYTDNTNEMIGWLVGWLESSGIVQLCKRVFSTRHFGLFYAMPLCSKCQQDHPKESYSKKQQKKKGKRVCSFCLGNATSPPVSNPAPQDSKQFKETPVFGVSDCLTSYRRTMYGSQHRQSNKGFFGVEKLVSQTFRVSTATDVSENHIAIRVGTGTIPYAEEYYRAPNRFLKRQMIRNRFAVPTNYCAFFYNGHRHPQIRRHDKLPLLIQESFHNFKDTPSDVIIALMDTVFEKFTRIRHKYWNTPMPTGFNEETQMYDFGLSADELFIWNAGLIQLLHRGDVPNGRGLTGIVCNRGFLEEHKVVNVIC